MDARNSKSSKLNYFWIGPPKTKNVNTLESDVENVIDMSKKSENPIMYYCLNEHKNHYEKIFQHHDSKITVISIEEHLKNTAKTHRDQEICQHASTLLNIKNELLDSSRNRIVDRVTFKDAFSLFILASEGGYTVDTGIKPNDLKGKKISFDGHNEIKAPYNKSNDKTTVMECWMMYAPENKTNDSKKMLGHYLSKWDSIQDIIRNKKQDDFESIYEFHSKITQLIIESVQIPFSKKENNSVFYDNKKFDPAWQFQLNDNIAIPKDIPVTKKYENSHKPHKECLAIIEEKLKHVEENQLTNITKRKELLDSIKKIIETTTKNNMIAANCILTATKEIDKYASQLSKISTTYQSNSNDKTKHRLAKKISDEINQVYEALENQLNNKRFNQTSALTSINDTLTEFKKNIHQISQEASKHHSAKHPLPQFRGESRFESKIKETLTEIKSEQNDLTPKKQTLN